MHQGQHFMAQRMILDCGGAAKWPHIPEAGAITTSFPLYKDTQRDRRTIGTLRTDDGRSSDLWNMITPQLKYQGISQSKGINGS